MLTVTIEGKAELTERINNALEVIDDLTDEFESLGETLQEFFSTEPFLSQGGVYGQRWPGLKPNSKLAKQKKYPGRNVLVASGAMMDAFKFVATPVSVMFMNSSKLFPYHQMGTGEHGAGGVGVGRGNNLPQRVMMQLDETRQQLAVDTFGNELMPRIEDAFNGQ